MAGLFAVNTLYFIVRASNPVIQADGWFYLEFFLKKAADHHLAFADFFIKRDIDDHASPVFRLLLLINYFYFHLDYVLDAVVGCVSACACCLIYRSLIFFDASRKPISGLFLSWITICALTLSLNSYGVWVWPLVTLENLTQLFILLFVIAVWHAHRREKYTALAAATILLGITSDDSALIAVVAAMTSYGLMLLVSPAQRGRPAWKVFLTIGICIVLVRCAYAYLTWDFIKHSKRSLVALLPALFDRFSEGGWWKWLFIPLTLPVYYENPFGQFHVMPWHIFQGAASFFLFAAHVAFWRRALRGQYNLTIFAAVNLMLLAYGWVAGILLWRVSWAGNTYLEQPRYVLFYTCHLIALALMWAGSLKDLPKPAHVITWKLWFPAAICALILLLQIPQSIAAWHARRYEWAYYITMSRQLRALAQNPVSFSDCALLQPLCSAPPARRATLTAFLKQNKLNIFSPRVQQWHAYLSEPNGRTD